jgi:hypothetical protein
VAKFTCDEEKTMSEEIERADAEPALDEVVGGSSSQHNPLHSPASNSVTELSVDQLEQVAGGLKMETGDTELLKVKSANPG